jgi:hypothetical protein
MKGETIMNRFKLLMLTANRSRLLLLTAFAVAVTVFVSGLSVTYAADPATAHAKRAELMDKIAKKRADDGARARSKRADLLKQRKDAKDYMRKVLEGQANGPNSGGAK